MADELVFNDYFVTYTLIRGGLYIGASIEIEATEIDAAYQSVKGRIEPDDQLVSVSITLLSRD